MRANTERRLRRGVALRAGCEPGGMEHAYCAYCGFVLLIMRDEGREPEFWMTDGSAFPSDEPAHLDHVIPECRNGPTSLDNTVIVCAPCNRAKGAGAFGEPSFLVWLAERRAQMMMGVSR